MRVVSDTLSTALDEPEQHLQTIRIASPLGSFWLRSALGTSRPTAARAVQNGASYEHRGRAQMAVMAASDAIPTGGVPVSVTFLDRGKKVVSPRVAPGPPSHGSHDELVASRCPARALFCSSDAIVVRARTMRNRLVCILWGH